MRFLVQIAGLLLITIAATTLAEANNGLPQNRPVPGGVAVIALPASNKPLAVYYNNSRVMVKQVGNKQYAIVGIPLAAKLGTQLLHLHRSGSIDHTVKFSITAKKYAEQHIHLDNQRLVNPTAEDLVRINHESALSQKAFRTWSDMEDVDTQFLKPVTGRLSSPFGLKRFFNGEPKRPHSGLDIAAPEGTPIVAPASGVVVIRGDFFYNGNTLFIDHGQGLVTMYCHMSRIDVTEGQKISRGQVLGAVGKSGRATGPHLHFSVSLNDTRVEPLAFLPTDIAGPPSLESSSSVTSP